MKLRMILASGLLVATTAAAQERAARPTAVFAPAEPAPAGGRLAEPALELGADERRAIEQGRDIRQLKSDMAAVRQMLQNQQVEIDQLRACLKIHDQMLAGMPMLADGPVGPKRLDKPLSEYHVCKM